MTFASSMHPNPDLAFTVVPPSEGVFTIVEPSDGPQIPDRAEATDGDELGEELGDDSLPGTVGFPPTTHVGLGPADSPQDADHHDSIQERSDREEPTDQSPPHDVVRLIDPDPGTEPDIEAQLIGDAVPPVGVVSAEEAAMHIESDQQQHQTDHQET